MSTGTVADRGTDQAADPPGVALRSRQGAALVAATVLASMVGSYDAYVVNVAVPAIGAGLHAGVSAVQWTLTSYLLTVGGLLLLPGRSPTASGDAGCSRSACSSCSSARPCARWPRRSAR